MDGGRVCGQEEKNGGIREREWGREIRESGRKDKQAGCDCRYSVPNSGGGEMMRRADFGGEKEI